MGHEEEVSRERRIAAGDEGGKLFDSTCSWIEGRTGIPGAGPPIIVALAVVVVSLSLCWLLGRARRRPDKLSQKVEQSRSALQEITERERERRQLLEAEVEQIRELKRKKAEDIERLRQIKDDEERKVRDRQEAAQQEALRRKELELARLQLEKEALSRAHTEGMLCVLKDAKALLPDMSLRVPLVDSVGMPATIAHLKSRLRADYYDQPPENRQRIVHSGKPQSDAVKLVDLFNLHKPQTDPVPFFVIVSQDVPPPPRTRRPQPQPQANTLTAQAQGDLDSAVSVRVKRGKLGPDLLLNMRLKHTIEHVSLEILALGVPLPCPQALAGSVLPTQLGGDVTRVRVVLGGRILASHETLSQVVSEWLDKSQLSLSVFVVPEEVRLLPSASAADTCMQVESEAQKDGGRQTLGTLHATQQQPSGTGSLSTSSGEGKEQEEADKDESVGRRHGGAKDDSGGGGSTAHRAEQLEQSLPDTTPASASEHSATEGRHAPANHQAKDASLANAATLLQRRQLAQSATEQWAKGVLGGWLAADAACTFVANRGPGEAVVVPRDETRLPCSQTDAVGQGHHETGDGCHIFSNGESHQVHLAGAKHAADEQGSHEGSPSLLPATNQALKHSGEAYVKPNAGKEPRNEGGVFAEGQREVVVGFKCMGSDTVLSVTLKYDAIVSEVKGVLFGKLFASTAPAARTKRIMLVHAGKVLKDDLPLVQTISVVDGCEQARGGVGAGDKMTNVVHVVMIDQTPQTTAERGSLTKQDEDEGTSSSFALAPTLPALPLPAAAPAVQSATAAPRERAESTPARPLVPPTAVIAGCSAQEASPPPDPSEAAKQAVGAESAKEEQVQGSGASVVVGGEGKLIRVEIEVEQDKEDSGEEDEEDQLFELLVATDARMQDVVTAASSQLACLSKPRPGQCVDVLEFGGRALLPTDTLSHLLRVVSGATREAWLTRQRPLFLRARLKVASASTGAHIGSSGVGGLGVSGNSGASIDSAHVDDKASTAVKSLSACFPPPGAIAAADTTESLGVTKIEAPLVSAAAASGKESHSTGNTQDAQVDGRTGEQQKQQPSLDATKEAERERKDEKEQVLARRVLAEPVGRRESVPSEASSMERSDLRPQPGASSSKGSQVAWAGNGVADRRVTGKRQLSVVVKDVLGGRRDLRLQVAPNLSVAELKSMLCMTYRDSPAPARQRVVCQGRLIADEETVGSLLGGAARTPVLGAAAPRDIALEFFVTIHPRG